MISLKTGNIRNLDVVRRFLKNVPHGTKKEAVIGIAEYLIGDERHGFRHDAPYMRTTRKRVYGRTFESLKQQRYVMWMINSGVWTGQRMRTPTDASQAYRYKTTDSGYGAVITNNSAGAYWTRVWRGWKNWRPAAQVIQDNIKGALRHATARVNSLVLKKGGK